MNEPDDQLKKKLDEAIAAARVPDASRDAIAILFPRAEKILRSFASWHHATDVQRRRQRRISVPDLAATYFRISPEKIGWGKSEFESILNLPDPRMTFIQAEDQINAASETDKLRLRRLFLENLDGSFGTERRLTLQWLNAIVEASPAYLVADRVQTPQFFMLDNSYLLRSIITNGLESFHPDERGEMVLEAVRNAADLSILCELIRAMAGDVKQEGAKRDDDEWFGESLWSIRLNLLNGVERLAENGQLWFQSRPEFLLWFWWGCDREEEVREFTNEAVTKPAGLRVLLDVTVSTAVSSVRGEYEKVSKDSWGRIVDLQMLASKAATLLSEANVTDQDQYLARRFLQALENASSQRGSLKDRDVDTEW